MKKYIYNLLKILIIILISTILYNCSFFSSTKVGLASINRIDIPSEIGYGDNTPCTITIYLNDYSSYDHYTAELDNDNDYYLKIYSEYREKTIFSFGGRTGSMWNHDVSLILDTSNFSKGDYFIYVVGAGETYSHPLLIK